MVIKQTKGFNGLILTAVVTIARTHFTKLSLKRNVLLVDPVFAVKLQEVSDSNVISKY